MIEIIYIFLIGQNKCTNLFHQHRYVDFTMPLTSTNDKNRWTAPEVLIRWQHNAEIFMASRENHHSNTTNIWKHNWSTQERERTTHCGLDEDNLKVSIRHEHSTEFTHLNPFLGHIHTLLHTPQWVWFTEVCRWLVCELLRTEGTECPALFGSYDPQHSWWSHDLMEQDNEGQSKKNKK